MKQQNTVVLAAAGLFSAATAANAQPVTTVVDAEMKTRTFLIDSDRDGNLHVIRRALSDDAVGVYCEWKATGNVDDAIGANSYVHIVEADCKISEPADTEQWEGGHIIDFERAYGPTRRVISPDVAQNIVVESRHTGPVQNNIVSELRRVWDVSANEVCISAMEGFKGQGLYINQDFGCYEMPNNDYARKIATTLEQ